VQVSGPSLRKPCENQEISLDMMHRASVVANTRIRFKNKQLYQLIHEHLLLSGLKKAAEALRKAGLEKTRVKKKKPAQWGFLGFFGYFCFFWGFCPEERVFRVFQFQEYFKVHPDFKNYNQR
jgi:hypothetical protein